MSGQTNIPETPLQTMQVITLAMVSGVVVFGVVAAVLAGGLPGPPTGKMISLLAAVVAGMLFVAHLVVPGMVGRSVLTADVRADDAKLMGVFQAQLLIRLALLEGAAFLNLVVFLIEHNWWSLAIAGGLVFWMLSLFPTRTRVAHWMEDQRALRD
jgi:F0F1-type ATP synthase membrane subunit c/vacuolar-type H+-ATPase subunit K